MKIQAQQNSSISQGLIQGPPGTGYTKTRADRALSSIRWIVVHYTGCEGSAAMLASSMARPNRKAGTHFFVDENQIVQSIDIGKSAWHIGDGRPVPSYAGYDHAKSLGLRGLGCTNASSIAVDICATKTSGAWEHRGERRAAALVKELMRLYTIPLDRVVRHYDCTGKPCPRPFTDDPARWEEFKKLLED